MSQQIDKKRIVFLFGAGVSIPAGMPCTQAITDKILSGENIMHHTDGNYYFGKPLYHHMGLPDEYVPKILSLLRIIKREVDTYYHKYRFKMSTNYEDYYFLAKQIYDTERGEYDNPAILPMIEKAMQDIKPILIGENYETRKEWELENAPR